MRIRKFIARHGRLLMPLPWLVLAAHALWPSKEGGQSVPQALCYLGVAVGFFLIHAEIARKEKILRRAEQEEQNERAARAAAQKLKADQTR